MSTFFFRCAAVLMVGVLSGYCAPLAHAGETQQPAPIRHEPCPPGQTCPSAQALPPLPTLAAPPPPLPVPPRVRPRRGMMITGWSILATSYFLSVAVGATVYDSAHLESLSDIDKEDEKELEYHIHRVDRRAYGRRMSVPLVGPWIAMGKVNSAAAALGTAMMGVAQLGGLTLGAIGTYRFVHDKQQQRVNVSVMPLHGGAQTAVTWNF